MSATISSSYGAYAVDMLPPICFEYETKKPLKVLTETELNTGVFSWWPTQAQYLMALDLQKGQIFSNGGLNKMLQVITEKYPVLLENTVAGIYWWVE